MIIIASAGITTVSEDGVRRIILSGADVLRHNFSYYGIDENLTYIDKIQHIVEELHASTKHLIDLPLNKIRLGDFDLKTHAVKEGEEITLRSASYTPDCREFVPIQLPKLGENVTLNQMITLGDGEVALQITEIINSDIVKARVLNNGVIKFIKTFNINKRLDADGLIKTYEIILEKLQKSQIISHPDFICVSYIDEKVNWKIKQIPQLKFKQHPTKIIVKIENLEGINNLEKICQDDFYDIILLDRGELGVNDAFEKVGVYQRMLISLAHKYHKPVIISTQILESVMYNYTPTRSEISDLTNIVLCGARGIMLCNETGAGTRPSYAVKIAKKIIDEVEKYKQTIITQTQPPQKHY